MPDESLARAHAERDWRKGGSYECNPYPTGCYAWLAYQRRMEQMHNQSEQREREQIHAGL